LLQERRDGLKIDAGGEAHALADLQRFSATLPPAPAWHDPADEVDLAVVDDPAEVEAERAEHAERVPQYDATLAEAGLASARAVDDVIDLMIRFGLITAAGEDQRLTLAGHPPQPTEILPLTDEKKQCEDRLRWQSRFGGCLSRC
jgi:hypothetical protein